MNRIIFLIVLSCVVISVSACSSITKKARITFGPVDDDTLAPSVIEDIQEESPDTLLSREEEQELIALARELEDEIELEGLEELINIEI